METKKNKKNYYQKGVIVIALILTPIAYLVQDTATLYPPRLIGGLLSVFLTSLVLSLVFGILPYLFERKRIKNPEIVIFGGIYIIVILMQVIGNFL